MKMKAIFILTSLIFLVSVSNAQEFAPLGAKWTYCYTSGAGTQNESYGIDTIEFTGDLQLINGISCKKLKSIFGGDYYIYQDSNQVFYYNSQRDSFFLLYDFSIQPSEQFQTAKWEWNIIPPPPVDYMTIQIETRDTQWVNNVPLSFFRGTIICESGIWENDMIYNDRFGAVNQFVIYPLEYCLIDWGIHHTFRSYEDPELGLYMPDLIVCPMNVAIHSTTKTEDIAIFPNPVQNRLFLPKDLPIIDLEIIDPTGNRKEAPFSSNSINVEDLPAGFYFLRIEVQGEKFITRRFVKY